MQTCNNVQMNGWSCSPKHGPGHFTVLKTLFIWIVRSFSKTFELMAGPCSPKHGPVPFTVLKNHFVWMLCSHVKTFNVMAGPRSPTPPVTTQLISRRWRIILFWCCTDFQQRSNKRLNELLQKRSRAFHGVENSFFLDGTKLFKNIRTCGWVVLPQVRLVPFTVLKNHFVWMLCSHVKTFNVMAGPRSPTPPVTAQLISRRWRIILFWCCTDFQQRSNKRLNELLQKRSRAFHGVENSFFLDGTKLFKNIRTCGWVVLPQVRLVPFTVLKNHFVWMLCSHVKTFKFMAEPRSPTTPVTAQLILRRWKIILFWCNADFQPRSKERMVVFPQTRSRSFHGVEKNFRLDGKTRFKNIPTYGWAVFPKHSPVLFTVLKNLLVCMFCSHVKTFMFKAGPRSPTSPVTAQLISRRRKIISIGCCADMQQRSNERMVALPQTHSRSFHGVDDFSHLNGRKLFKNIRTYGWAVLPQTRPSSFHGVEEPFRLMLCSRLNTFKFMAGPRSPTSPVTAQLFSQRWEFILFWCCADFKQRLNERLVVLPQTRSSAFHGVEDSFYLDSKKLLKNIRTYGWAGLPETRPSSIHIVEEHFCLDVMQPCKHIQVYGWAALPNIPCHGPAHFAALKNHFVLMLCGLSPMSNRTAGRVPPNTVPLIWRYGRTFSFEWYEAFQKHSNLWLGRAPPNTTQNPSRCGKTLLSGCYATIEKHSSLWLGRAPQHPLSRPSSFCGVEESFRFDVVQTFKNVQMNGWSCSPKHSPRHFTVLKTFFIWMVWSFSKTFELMAGPCSLKHGPVPFTVFKNLFVWMLSNHVKTFKFMAGPRSPTSPVTAKLISRRSNIILFWCCADFQQRSNERLIVLPQHGPGRFTVLKTLFIWLVWSFSKTFELMAGWCSPKRG